MKSDDSDIQTHYIDALGQAPRLESWRRSTRFARRCEGGRRRAPSRFDAVIVVDAGGNPRDRPVPAISSWKTAPRSRSTIGSRRICLRDITRIRRRDGTTARVIVAPETCYLPESLRIWGWAIQLYAARSRRSWGIGDLADLRRLGTLGRAGGCRDRAHQSARGGFAAHSAAAEPLLSVQPAFSQPALPQGRGGGRGLDAPGSPRDCAARTGAECRTADRPGRGLPSQERSARAHLGSGQPPGAAGTRRLHRGTGRRPARVRHLLRAGGTASVGMARMAE